MSQENVELARQGYDALNRGGVEAILEFLDPEVELVPTPNWLPDPETFHGHEGVRAWFRKVGDTAEDFRWQPLEHVDAGNRFAVAVRVRGTGKTSGVPVEATLYHVWTVRDGKGIRLESYADRPSALEAVGS